jgi:ATP-dependent helicase/DNAse subunit B
MTDTEVRTVFSHSELKTYQRCPKQWEYKYEQLLVPKAKSKPLFMGNWVHKALETHYSQGDWKIGHNEYVNEWNRLFEEERIALRTKRGKISLPPFPEIVERIMRSYVWYYRDEGWKVVATEQEFEVPTPLTIDGEVQMFKGIIDLIIEDEEGLLWIIDHKTASNIPEATSFHGMDPQLMLYPWAAKRMWGMDIAGIYYNYVKSKPPTIPTITKTGALSRRKIVTDYPTYVRFLKANGYDPHDFREELVPLQKKSPYLRRYRYPREKVVTQEVVLDALTTVQKIRRPERHIRVITRDCSRMCSYHNICRAELNGFDTAQMRKHDFDIREKKEVPLEVFVGDWEDDDA